MVFILYKLYFLSPYTNPTPKPTPLQETTGIFTFSKNSFCMIYKLCTHGDLNLGPHRDTSLHESVCIQI